MYIDIHVITGNILITSVDTDAPSRGGPDSGKQGAMETAEIKGMGGMRDRCRHVNTDCGSAGTVR
jgi:hypothetical protein